MSTNHENKVEVQNFVPGDSQVVYRKFLRKYRYNRQDGRLAITAFQTSIFQYIYIYIYIYISCQYSNYGTSRENWLCCTKTTKCANRAAHPCYLLHVHMPGIIIRSFTSCMLISPPPPPHTHTHK